MNRSVVTLVLAGFLASPLAVAEEGFRKQIVVYLDASGSMLPRSLNPDDPFQKTLEALQLFLAEPDFVTAADSITVVTFGGQVASKTRWTGDSTLELQAIPRESKAETDFAAVFDHLGGELDKNADRRLVIIASDFIQEPRARGESPGSSLASWNGLARTRLAHLKQQFGNNPKQRLLLLQAPVREDRQAFLAVREQIVDAIVTATAADRFDIGAGGLAADELARQIRKKLLYDLEVEARLDTEESLIQVTVTNPNGSALRLEESFQVTCLDEHGRELGDSAKVAIPPEDTGLGPRGTQASTRTLSPPPLILNCLVRAPRYRVDVTSREGAEGSVSLSTDGWIVHRVDDARVEGRLFQSDLLRLYLGMRGHGAQGERFRLKVFLNGQSQSTKPLKEVSFVAPPDLAPFEEKTFLFALNVPEGTTRGFDGKRAIRVEIDDSLVEGSGSRDAGATTTNFLLGWFCILLGCGQVSLLWVQREKLRRLLEAVLTLLSAASSNFPAILVALVSPRQALLRVIPGAADWVQLLVLVLLVPIATFLMVRQYLGLRMARELRSPDPNLTAIELVKRLRDTRPAIAAALVVLIIITFSLVATASWPIHSTDAIPVAVQESGV